MEQTKPAKPKSMINVFFSLGDKVTKNPKQKADFDYYMMWIIFLAFFIVFLGNIYSYFSNGYHIQNLGWALFGLAIMWFQYFNLRMMYGMRKMIKESPNINLEDDDEDDDKEIRKEDVDDMIDSFKKKELKGGLI